MSDEPSRNNNYCLDSSNNEEVRRQIMEIENLKKGDYVLVKCKVEAVFPNSGMVMVTTKDCDDGFDAYIDEIVDLEDMEEPFITETRNAAIACDMPLYFIYHEETGVFESYITKTKELFEKRHCIKHLPDYRFKELARQYLDDYSEFVYRQLGG